MKRRPLQTSDGVGDGKAPEAIRKQRLKAALKANLGRRKAQARARGDEADAPDPHGSGKEDDLES